MATATSPLSTNHPKTGERRRVRRPLRLHPSKPKAGFHPNPPQPGASGTPGFHPNPPKPGASGTPGLLGTPDQILSVPVPDWRPSPSAPACPSSPPTKPHDSPPSPASSRLSQDGAPGEPGWESNFGSLGWKPESGVVGWEPGVPSGPPPTKPHDSPPSPASSRLRGKDGGRPCCPRRATGLERTFPQLPNYPLSWGSPASSRLRQEGVPGDPDFGSLGWKRDSGLAEWEPTVTGGPPPAKPHGRPAISRVLPPARQGWGRPCCPRGATGLERTFPQLPNYPITQLPDLLGIPRVLPREQ